MTVPIIVQARMSSKRLPGKVTMPWGDTTLIGHILTELGKVGEPVWVATSTDPSDFGLAHHAFAHPEIDGVYRGDLDDVLARFVGCIDWITETEGKEPDAIVRVCADRPHMDAAIIVQAIRYWQDNNADYVTAAGGGRLVEVIRTGALRNAADEATSPYDREHVTPWVRRNVARRFVLPMTVDTHADYLALCPKF